MNLEGVYWLALFVAVMIPVWAIFLFVRSRLGVSRQAWSAASHGGIGPGPHRSSEPDEPQFRDPRDRPGHCPSCGEPIDEYEFDRCWNCARTVR
ncbi:hypothetical protein [Natronoglomus mannanivorans]|uniref:Uncharacterized protein n=1 Tax=Natronoglomus mannanivorans TaxID=2979990 RepID=A0AAP2YZA1_9EURY|nr:hypothetical protein [Halobacteria archaeon AArc-xg1-1]